MNSLNPKLGLYFGLLVLLAASEKAYTQTTIDACKPEKIITESIESHITQESNVKFIKLHQSRLQADIKEIETRLRRPPSDTYLDWMKESDQRNLNSKQENLKTAEKALKMLETPGEALPLFQSFLDIARWVTGENLDTINSHLTPSYSSSKKSISRQGTMSEAMGEDAFQQYQKAALTANIVNELKAIIDDPENTTLTPTTNEFIEMLTTLSDSIAISPFITYDAEKRTSNKQKEKDSSTNDDDKLGSQEKITRGKFGKLNKKTVISYPDEFKGLSSEEKKQLLKSLVEQGTELFYEANFQKAMMSQTNDNFSDSALPFFNPETNPEASKFLMEIGLSTQDIKPEASRADLSQNYPAPRSQLDTLACVGCALASDLESFPEVPKLAAGFPIATAVAAAFSEPGVPIEDEIRKTLQRKLSTSSPEAAENALKRQGIDPMVALEQSLIHPLPTNDNFPFPRILPEKISQIDGSRYGVTSYASFETFRRTPKASKEKKPEKIRKPNFQFFKLLLDNGIAPQVSISTNARSFLEDWLRVEPLQGIGHQFVIVGYDVKIDPWDGTEKQVFIVRDSFTQKSKDGTYEEPGHFYVSAATTLPLILGVYKVTGIQKYDDTNTKLQDN